MITEDDYTSHIDYAAYLAYVELVGEEFATIEQLEEAYAGEYRSDEDFAQDLAEDIGAVDSNAVWPNNCIDWTHAARELMYDYTESNGYYFRNL